MQQIASFQSSSIHKISIHFDELLDMTRNEKTMLEIWFIIKTGKLNFPFARNSFSFIQPLPNIRQKRKLLAGFK